MDISAFTSLVPSRIDYQQVVSQNAVANFRNMLIFLKFPKHVSLEHRLSQLEVKVTINYYLFIIIGYKNNGY